MERAGRSLLRPIPVSDRNRLVARAGSVSDFDAAVLQLTNTVRSRYARHGFAERLAGDRTARDAVAGEILGRARVAALRQAHVVLRRTRPVGVTGQHDRHRAAV